MVFNNETYFFLEKKKKVLSTAFVRQEQMGSTISKKPCLNLCSRK